MDSSIFILILTLAIQNVVAYSAEYTITVEPGKEDCFFLDVPQNSYLELDYQVIDGQQGELDIDFYIASPSGRRIVMESRKSDSSHRNQITESGDHSICFDNSFSIFSSKTVFFEISTDNDDDDQAGDDKSSELWGDIDKSFYAGLRPEEIYEIHVQDIKDSVAKVRGKLTKAQLYQDQLRAYEARDRNVAESNFSRVNFWSVIHIISLVITGLIQVIMLRSLFDEKSAMRHVWKKSGM